MVHVLKARIKVFVLGLAYKTVSHVTVETNIALYTNGFSRAAGHSYV